MLPRLLLARMHAYKICQMYMSIGIEEHVIWLHVSVDNTLSVYVPQGTTQLGDPESDSFFGECLSRDMEEEIAATHEIDY